MRKPYARCFGTRVYFFPTSFFRHVKSGTRRSCSCQVDLSESSRSLQISAHYSRTRQACPAAAQSPRRDLRRRIRSVWTQQMPAASASTLVVSLPRTAMPSCRLDWNADTFPAMRASPSGHRPKTHALCVDLNCSMSIVTTTITTFG
jgi:hypothetical protein